MSLNVAMRPLIAKAERANELYALAMQIFQANCERANFELAEAERDRIHALIDDYMDAMILANRRLEQARLERK